MAQISQLGALNTTALAVPDLYVQIVPSQALTLNGAASNRIGIVGTSSWGPANQAVVVGSLADYNIAFGPVLPRGFDMGTAVSCAQQQGAQSFVCVRVTDGSDTSATYALLYSNGTYPLLLTAVYSGSLGNSIKLALDTGSRAGSWKLTLQMPGRLAEVFDNIDGSAGAQSFWSNLARAVNNGTGASRGPSALCVATVGNGTTTSPSTVLNQVLLNGSDGTSGMSPAMLVGSDGLSRTGMYALRGQGCALGMLADCSDAAQWEVQAGFGLSEGIYMVLTGPSGDDLASAVQRKQNAGLDSYGAKLMFGDWLYWYDQDNSQTRLVSPQGFVVGRLASLSPEQSSLNKALVGIVGSQKSGMAATGQASTYSSAELERLFSQGIDVIANPAPGGQYWAVRCGHNTSSDQSISTDSYTRMTNFIARSLSAGMGLYVGSVINQTLLSNIKATLLSYLSALVQQKILGSVDGRPPYAVVCDQSNNPGTRTALGYVQADVQVRYQGINEKFIVNLQGGQNVAVTSTNTLQ